MRLAAVGQTPGMSRDGKNEDYQFVERILNLRKCRTRTPRPSMEWSSSIRPDEASQNDVKNIRHHGEKQTQTSKNIPADTCPLLCAPLPRLSRDWTGVYFGRTTYNLFYKYAPVAQFRIFPQNSRHDSFPSHVE